MKKFYYLALLLTASTMSFGQSADLFFSMYGEGSGSNRFLEIYNGTGHDIDLSDYAFPNTSNDVLVSGDYEYWNSFPDGAVIADGDVYVIAHPDGDEAITSKANYTFRYLSNGNDGFALVKGGTWDDIDNDGKIDLGEMTGFTTLDRLGTWYGATGTGWDVAGITDATVDHTFIRKSEICDASSDWATSAGTNADNSEWVVSDIDTEWNKIGSHSACGSVETPKLSLLSLNNFSIYTLSHIEAEVNIKFKITNFEFGTDGQIAIKSFDGSGEYIPTQASPIALQDYVEIALGSHTVILELQDNGGNSLTPEVLLTINFTINEVIDVDDIASLKSMIPDDDIKLYRITGNTLVINQQVDPYNKLWFRDNTGSIVMYIDDGSKTENIIGDTYKNIIGSLKDYYGLLEILPHEIEPFLEVSSGSTVTPTLATLDQINNEEFNSDLVMVEDVLINDFDGGTGLFLVNTYYLITATTGANAGKECYFKIDFNSADYIGKTIPTGKVDIIAIIGKKNDAIYLTPRMETDIHTSALNISKLENTSVKIFPNPAKNILSYESESNEIGSFEILDISGRSIINSSGNLSNKTLDVSGLNKGTYILKVSHSNGKYTYKFYK